MKIEIAAKTKQKDIYLTSLCNNEPGIYIGNNDHFWIVGRDKKIDGYFSSTMKDFCALDSTWKDCDIVSEHIRRYDGDLVLRNIP